jgi:hypothetical protein
MSLTRTSGSLAAKTDTKTTDTVPEGAKRSRRRALMLVPIAAGSAALLARSRFAQPVVRGDSIRASPQYQDAALLARAWSLPVARRMQPGFRYQRNPTTCGPASLAIVQRSLGREADEAAVLAGTGKCWTGLCIGGVTLDELAEIAGHQRGHHPRALRDLSFEEFEAQLRSSNDPRRRYIVNFHRGPLFGEGHGHHSPVGGYLEPENLVFVLDTNERYRPFLVEPRRLYEAMNTVDTTGGKKRGLLLIE